MGNKVRKCRGETAKYASRGRTNWGATPRVHENDFQQVDEMVMDERVCEL